MSGQERAGRRRRRVSIRAQVVVCGTGHTVDVGGPAEATQVRCWRCDNWTWEDGNYCVRCGAALAEEMRTK